MESSLGDQKDIIGINATQLNKALLIDIVHPKLFIFNIYAFLGDSFKCICTS